MSMTLNAVSKLTEDDARAMFERIRWPNGPMCPHCLRSKPKQNFTKLAGKKHRAGLYKCNDCDGQFTATVGTSRRFVAAMVGG